jgi:hypothetical protein
MKVLLLLFCMLGIPIIVLHTYPAAYSRSLSDVPMEAFVVIYGWFVLSPWILIGCLTIWAVAALYRFLFHH